MNAPAELVRQHLIDPEICIRCNTCEETCPVKAITHDARNYVVNFDVCEGCRACVPPCPTGAIDSWRKIAKAQPYTLEQQLSWDSLPTETDPEAGGESEIPDEVVQITAIATAGRASVCSPM
jgi:benzoyl-CoA 2,3-epoxidase subunit A